MRVISAISLYLLTWFPLFMLGARVNPIDEEFDQELAGRETRAHRHSW